MTQYVLTASQYTNASDLQKAVSQLYHVGFSNGTVFYGYMLEPNTSKDGGWHEKTDIASKDKLIQYSSENLIDRDFVFWPRVSQGDFSGGALQPVFLDATKFFFGNLDTRLAGYLTLPTALTTSAAVFTATGSPPPGISASLVTCGGLDFAAFGDSGGTQGQVGRLNANGTVTSLGIGATLFMDTDGLYLYTLATAAGDIKQYTTAGALHATVTNGTNGGGITQFWVIPQGTSGFFLYYTTVAQTLYKVDLTAAFPVAAGAQPQMPLGGIPMSIIDIVPYNGGIAILSGDANASGSSHFKVWTHDGANLTLMADVAGYVASGMCNCLGNLYVIATGKYVEPPGLFRVSTGAIEQVVRIAPSQQGPSGAGFTTSTVKASGKYVWFSTSYQPNSLGEPVFAFDTVSGALHCLDTSGAALSMNGNGVRAFTVGTGVLTTWKEVVKDFCFSSQTTGGYPASGSLMTSKIDLNTPSVEKRFRRGVAVHRPLPANTTIQIDAFIDKDPVDWTSSLTPDATVTNSTVNSTSTVLNMNQLIGQSAYFVYTLTTSDGVSTPAISWFSVEVTTPFSWPMTLSCTAVRRNLAGNEDTQGVTGKDLYYFFRNAWETPTTLTMYHRNGTQYSVAIESFDAWNPSPKVATEAQVPVDEESIVSIVVRQTA